MTNYNWPPRGVTSINNLVGDVTLAAGSNITLTSSDNTITIASSGGGGGSPGGNANDVQFNDGAGAFAGNDNFTFDPGSNVLLLAGELNVASILSGSISVGDGNTLINGDGSASFAGTVSFANVKTPTVQDSSGLHTITLDNATIQNHDGAIVFDWENAELLDTASMTSIFWSTRILVNGSSTNVLDWSGGNASGSAYYFDSGNSNRLTGDGSGLSGVLATVSIGSSISGATQNAVLYANSASNLSSSPNFLFDENANELLLAASNIALDSSGNLTVFSELQLYFNGSPSGIINPTTNPAENTGYLIWQPQQDSDPVIGLSSASTAGNYVLLGYRDGAGAFLQYGLSFSELRIEAYGGALGSVQATSINDAAFPSVVSIDVDNRILVDATAASSVDWVNRRLYDTTGTNFTIAWADVRLYDPSAVIAVDWGDRWLVNGSGVTQVDWQANLLTDGNSASSMDWLNRLLYDVSGSPVFGWGTNAQSLGFFSSVATSPVTQQASTNGAVSAGAVYTATEQAMLNDVYAAMRAYGLLT